MSTRATYCIDGKYFYIHYDGYKEGAAFYFYNAIIHENNRGGLAEKFIRANDLAEFTENHNVHGDTEYKYTVNGQNLTVYHRNYGKGWRTEYNGSLCDFVNKYAEENETVIFFHDFTTISNLKKHIGDKFNSLKINILNGWVGNASCICGEIIRIAKALAPINKDLEIFSSEIIDRVKWFTPYFIRKYGWTGETAISDWNARIYAD